MTLTLTLSRLPSFERPLEKLATAALTDPPIKNSASGVRAAPPTMLTTLPCEAFNSGQNSRVSRTQPKNLSAKPSSQVASDNSRKAPARVAPALLTRTSQRPKRSLTRLNNCSHAASVRKSPATVSGCGPAAAITLAAAARFCSEEEASTVCAPSRANASAMPRPIPRLAPEMTTILPLNSPGMSHPPCLPVDTVVYARKRRGNGGGHEIDLHRLQQPARAGVCPRAASRRPADCGQRRSISIRRPAAAARRLRCLPRRPLLYADRGDGPVPRAQAHRLLGHRRVELYGRPGVERARHQGAHHPGLRRHCGRRAHDGADIRLLPRSGAHGPGGASGRVGPARKHAAQRQDARPHRAWRHRPGGGADRPWRRHGGDRLQSLGAPGGRRSAPW